MFDQILLFSIHHRWLVLLTTFAMAALGIYSYQRLPIDAVPDITNVQVQVNTEAPGYSPLEAEQRITLPVEVTLATPLWHSPWVFVILLLLLGAEWFLRRKGGMA